jgi:UDP-glucose 4-epimerase
MKQTNLSKVMVMGGLGFMGSHLCKALLKAGYAVTIFDKLYSSRELVSNITAQIEVIESDIQKTDDFLAALDGIDIIVDLVHTTVPGSSMQSPVFDVQSNIVSHVAWLSRLGEKEVGKIIYVSSGGTVYGMPETVPINEKHSTHPISAYGITKLTIEKYVAMYANLYGIDYRICRPSNVYGEGQRLNIGQGVIGVFLDRVVRGLPIEMWGSGSNKRDYIHVSDFVSAVVSLINYSGDRRIFNIATSVGYSLKDIIGMIENSLNLHPEVLYKSSRGFDVPDSILDNSLLIEQTGWRPLTDLPEGLVSMYRWIRNKYTI